MMRGICWLCGMVPVIEGTSDGLLGFGIKSFTCTHECPVLARLINLLAEAPVECERTAPVGPACGECWTCRINLVLRRKWEPEPPEVSRAP